MKLITTLITIIFLGAFSESANAFFVVASAPGVEAREDAHMVYEAHRDALQIPREVKKLEDWALQLDRMQTQIENLIDLNKTAVETYYKAEHMVSEHGDWEDITPSTIVHDITRTSDQKLHTSVSIMNDIEKAPEKVVDKSRFLQKYVNVIDSVNWTQKKKSGKEAIAPEMTALEEYKIFVDYRKKVHGYKDESGMEHDGELQKLQYALEDAKRDLALAKTDVDMKTQMDRIKQIQSQIDYIYRKEGALRQAYQASLLASGQTEHISDLVAKNKENLVHKKDVKDKVVRVPKTQTIYDYFKKQEDNEVS